KKLVVQLGQAQHLLCLSGSDPAGDLYHQYDRGLSPADQEGNQDQRGLSIGYGVAETGLSCESKNRGGLGKANVRMAADCRPTAQHLRRPNADDDLKKILSLPAPAGAGKLKLTQFSLHSRYYFKA